MDIDQNLFHTVSKLDFYYDDADQLIMDDSMTHFTTLLGLFHHANSVDSTALDASEFNRTIIAVLKCLIVVGSKPLTAYHLAATINRHGIEQLQADEQSIQDRIETYLNKDVAKCGPRKLLKSNVNGTLVYSLVQRPLNAPPASKKTVSPLDIHDDDLAFTEDVIQRCEWKDCMDRNDYLIDDLKMHIEDKHVNIQTPPFTCLWTPCTYVEKKGPFKKKSDILTHIIKHIDGRRLICVFPGCNKSYRRKGIMIRHMATHNVQGRTVKEMEKTLAADSDADSDPSSYLTPPQVPSTPLREDGQERPEGWIGSVGEWPRKRKQRTFEIPAQMPPPLPGTYHEPPQPKSQRELKYLLLYKAERLGFSWQGIDVRDLSDVTFCAIVCYLLLRDNEPVNTNEMLTGLLKYGFIATDAPVPNISVRIAIHFRNVGLYEGYKQVLEKVKIPGSGMGYRILPSLLGE